MHATQLRETLSRSLGIPHDRCELAAEHRGDLVWDGLVIEKWVWSSEPGSRVPSVLYRPKNVKGKMPAVVLTCGHGGSKSHWQYTYIPQLYARLGIATLVLDPIGEEERHKEGHLGTRAHDPESVHLRAQAAGRLIMGKLVFDTMRGIDFLLERSDIDENRIGVAGNSLGGAKAGWMLALDTRLKIALVSGWTFDDTMVSYGKFCTRIPNQLLRSHCDWPEFLALAAPHCAVLLLNGDADVVIDKNGDGAAWRGARAAVSSASPLFADKGARGAIASWFEPGGGHRPYHGYPVALEWLHKFLGTPGWSLNQIRCLPSINCGAWCDDNGVELERLYGTDLHDRGTSLPDLSLRNVPREALACLHDHEIGHPSYTLEGWIDLVEKDSGTVV
ncbi:MAG: hypothetical protein HOH43_14955 [Candidatus Latescibacteria bacterium]|nr:hypothetical protein [Candidatus Latescibacterota bacterium]